MRLLWEENLLGAIGALLVAALALGAAWIVLEGVVQVHGWVAGILATLSAVGVLEAISRRYYVDDAGLSDGHDASAWSR